MHWCRSGCHVGWQHMYEFVWLWYLRTQHYLTSSWPRGYSQNLQLSAEAVVIMHKLSTFCRVWCDCSIVSLGLDDCKNHHFGCPILPIPLNQAVGCIHFSWLHRFVQSHMLLLNTLYAMLYCVGHCAHHTARFIIITQLVKLCILFNIFFVIHILVILRHSKIA